MQNKPSHLRNTFLTGIFALVPVGVTIFIIYKIQEYATDLTLALYHRELPLVGILIAISAIYVTGLIVSSIVGRWFFRLFDRTLSKVPGLNTAYQTWKQIALTPGGTEGTFSKVVLIPSEVGGVQVGFTSGRPIDGHESTWCVFIPNAPNPLTGRMHFIHKDRCTVLECAVDEAFKLVLSTGNYVPAEVGAAIAKQMQV